MYHVLFLCTHNSARSILAEALLNHYGAGQWAAYSAGSAPRPGQQPHPMALEALQLAQISVQGLHSKSWDAFAQAAQPLDAVITVCDQAAAEACPVFTARTGQTPARAHWGYADPSRVQMAPEFQLQAFVTTLHQIERRIQALVAQLPAALEAASLAATLRHLADNTP